MNARAKTPVATSSSKKKPGVPKGAAAKATVAKPAAARATVAKSAAVKSLEDAPTKAQKKPLAKADAQRKAGPSVAVASKTPSEAQALLVALRELHPDAHCELDHTSAFQLLVATVLSAQTTDKLVNRVTPHLFARYPDAASLAAANLDDVEETLRSNGLGMYRVKSKSITKLAAGLVERHAGEVPRTMAELVELAGVGRKTANVVLGVIWGIPDGVVVDTHVARLGQRLGLTTRTKPEDIEKDLVAHFPRESWDILSHTLIFHGRRICFAIKPACAGCGVAKDCPSAFHAEEVGRKGR